jgi:hypothetical protein
VQRLSANSFRSWSSGCCPHLQDDVNGGTVCIAADSLSTREVKTSSPVTAAGNGYTYLLPEGKRDQRMGMLTVLHDQTGLILGKGAWIYEGVSKSFQTESITK